MIIFFVSDKIHYRTAGQCTDDLVEYSPHLIFSPYNHEVSIRDRGVSGKNPWK